MKSGSGKATVAARKGERRSPRSEGAGGEHDATIRVLKRLRARMADISMSMADDADRLAEGPRRTATFRGAFTWAAAAKMLIDEIKQLSATKQPAKRKRPS